MEERPAVLRVAANILNKQSRTADKEWTSSLGGLGEVLTRHHRKNYLVTYHLQGDFLTSLKPVSFSRTLLRGVSK